jgi:nitrate reductase NapA
MDRRDFLLASGAAAATSTLGCSRETAVAPDVKSEIPLANVSWSKAPCRFCGTGCGVEVGVTDGKVVAVRGDELNAVNKGLLCVKGYHLPALLYGRDRLKQPLKRNDDGQGFRPISWNEALDLVASKFKETLEKHGPDAVAMYGSGQWTVFDGYAAMKWVKDGMRSAAITWRPTPAYACPARSWAI